MATNQQFPLAVSLAGAEQDILAPSTSGMATNGGTALRITVQASATTVPVTVRIYTRATPGRYQGTAVGTADVAVVQAAVYVIPAGTASYQIGPLDVSAASFVRATGAHGGGAPEAVTVSASVGVG